MTRSQMFQRIDQLNAQIDALSLILVSAVDEDEIDTLTHELIQIKAEKDDILNSIPDSL